jgi:transcription antitermination factor NusG
MNSPSALTQTLVPADFVSLHDEQPCWFALHACAQHEKRIAAELQRRGIENFLPLFRTIRQWKDRRKQLDSPLFPGYLFVRLALREKLKALQVPGVVRLVGFAGRPHPLPEQEIDALRVGITGGLVVQPHQYLTVGSRVRIVRGPLLGFSGILLRRKNVCRVVLSLNLIAQSASVEVSATDVERI